MFLRRQHLFIFRRGRGALRGRLRDRAHFSLVAQDCVSIDQRARVKQCSAAVEEQRFCVSYKYVAQCVFQSWRRAVECGVQPWVMVCLLG